VKKIFILIFILIITYGYSKDFQKTEEIINSILKEEGETAGSKDNISTENQSQIEKSTEKEQGVEDTNNEKTGDAATEESAKKTAMSGNDEILLKTGIQLYESGLYEHSLQRFNDILKNFPSSRFIDSAKMWSGKIYLRKYDYDNALKEFSSVGEKSGEYPAALFYKGESLRIKGNTVAAIENYQKVSSSFPENELADNSILITGKLYLNSGKGYQSLESALKIIRYYKDSESVDDAYYLIAKIYEKDPLLKDIELSRKFYRAFLKKAESGQKHFTDFFLKDVVKKDLDHLDRTYFKMER